MAQYIDKDAVVAEIENWKQHTLKCGYAGQGEYEEGNKQGRLDTCEKILSFLDTLEVKEVDLEKEYKMFVNCDEGRSMLEIARHFFELGLKAAQKGE